MVAAGGFRRRRGSVAPWRGGLVAVATAFAVSACGGDEVAGSAAAGTAGPSGSASPAGETGLWPEDFVLTEGPATAGYTGAPEEPSGDGENGEGGENAAAESVLGADLAECLGMSNDDLEIEPEASAVGLTFTGADGFSMIDSSADILTEKQVVRDREMLANPRTPKCLEEAFAGLPDEPAEDDDVTTISFEAFPPPGSAAAYYRMTIRGSDPEDTFVGDMLFFIEGRVEVTTSYVTLEAEHEPERLQQIADQISDKLRNQKPRSIAGRPTEAGPVVRALAPLAS
ncbi:hypothetical protein CC117_09600 [Parafrankia colletiae]|uniref:DUF5642 domain-containing protein n=1 Tax=Parafrankia colletiae TaxID=573497 RepID=A0A1S1RI71_9ACTN|nr:hypothetical protein CC117_09600 [Parafrankia colletiae]